jgi:hypothetical protein
LFREFWVDSGFKATEYARLDAFRGDKVLHDCGMANPVEAFFNIEFNHSFIDSIAV